MLERPHHEVGILLGQDVVHLLPTGVAGWIQVGRMRVIQVKFRSGYVLCGIHKSFRSSCSVTVPEEAKKITSVKLVNYMDERSSKYMSFLEAEKLVKVFVKSGETGENVIGKLGGQVWDHTWMREKDMVVFDLELNLQERKNCVKIGPSWRLARWTALESLFSLRERFCP